MAKYRISKDEVFPFWDLDGGDRDPEIELTDEEAAFVKKANEEWGNAQSLLHKKVIAVDGF